MSSKEDKSKQAQRRVFLITYSQANLLKFPTCMAFAEAVVVAFGSTQVVEWACCREPHKDGGVHYHMSISFRSSRRWGPVKRHFLENHDVSLNFTEDTCGYVAAYRYVCKNKGPDEVAHSPGHTPKDWLGATRSSDHSAPPTPSPMLGTDTESGGAGGAGELFLSLFI